jgi:hypothetical protein
MKVDVSNGEVIDKMTILNIKKEKIKDIDKLNNIIKEYDIIYNILSDELNNLDKSYYDSLYKINLQLWEVEDKLRIKEYKNEFDSEFIELARSVYILNDKRASIKREINNITNSNIIEEKDYINY